MTKSNSTRTSLFTLNSCFILGAALHLAPMTTWAANSNIYNQPLGSGSCQWALKPSFQEIYKAEIPIGRARFDFLRMSWLPGTQSSLVAHSNDHLLLVDFANQRNTVTEVTSQYLKSFNNSVNIPTRDVYNVYGITQNLVLIVTNNGRVSLIDLKGATIKSAWQIEAPSESPIALSRDRRTLYSLNRRTQQLTKLDLTNGGQLDIRLQMSRFTSSHLGRTPTQILAHFQVGFDGIAVTDDPDHLYFTTRFVNDLHSIAISNGELEVIRAPQKPNPELMKLVTTGPFSNSLFGERAADTNNNTHELALVEQPIAKSAQSKVIVITDQSINSYDHSFAILNKSNTILYGSINHGVLLGDLPQKRIIEHQAFGTNLAHLNPQVIDDQRFVTTSLTHFSNIATIRVFKQ